jgi:energy-coupling factor transport system ATP-binding protein
VADGPLVEVENLTFRYRRAVEPAIRDISLSVVPGEVLLVAGPSGCGKSTLIRAINGLIPHSYPGELTGDVRVAGRPTTELKLRDIAATVGTVLQDPGRQIVGSTVEAELAFGPENFGLDRTEIRERIRRVAELAEIGPLLARETSALSGGELQLLAMAGILMMEPRLYVIDEPLANLDPATAGRLLAILRSLADQANAVIIVEHRVEEALALRPDRVLYLDGGRQRYLGDAAGFLQVADPREVKLPFEVILARAIASPMSEGHSPPNTAGPGPDQRPRLEFRHVSASIGSHPVLHDVDVALRSHEIVAVLGPNGSGKTTMFRTAMKLLPVSDGEIAVDGEPIKGRTTSQLAGTFGYVFQSPSQMLFARTVREELVFGPRNLGKPPDSFDRIVDDALRRTSLDELDGIRERPPLALSFGQQKRLALAIALALEPPTLILDEPSAGQDHRTAEAFMREIVKLPGLESLYFITHDVDLALTHANRILLFREGRIVADGSPRDVIEDDERWLACNLTRTSLMTANRRWTPPTSGFLDADSLARSIASRGATGSGWEGGSPSLIPDG